MTQACRRRRIVHPHAQKGSIMSAVVALARDLETVAEGVETEDERAILRECERDVPQGYLFSRPLTMDQATDWLAARQPATLKRA